MGGICKAALVLFGMWFVSCKANLVKSDEQSDRFGNPGGVNINTATAIVANVYF
jgi:hypothetical protein